MASRAATGICLCRLRAWTGGGAARPNDSARAQPRRHGDRGRHAARLVVAARRFPPSAPRLWLRSARRGVRFRPAAQIPPLLLWGQSKGGGTADRPITEASSGPLRRWLLLASV